MTKYKLSLEQKEVIESDDNIRVNAIAGSGKTTTILEYAKSRPKTSKILYLVFNKEMQKEADSKFKNEGLHNVTIRTVHSFALELSGIKKKKLNLTEAFTSDQISELFNFNKNIDEEHRFKVAKLITDTYSFYCNSQSTEIENIFVPVLLQKEDRIKTVLNKYEGFIIESAKLIYEKQKDGKLQWTHDYYLKMCQLKKPTLPFDYILFDEAQDASGAMLSIVLEQEKTKKIFVGDTHQQIYGWRFAQNALDKINFESKYLSRSFRFNGDIAKKAWAPLEMKKKLGYSLQLPLIKGCGTFKNDNSSAIIGRSNLAIVSDALDLIDNHGTSVKIHIIKKTGKEDILDIKKIDALLLLQQGSIKKIKDQFVKKFKSLESIKSYSIDNYDNRLLAQIKLVEKYGYYIKELVKILPKSIVSQSKEADFVYSTVHQSKGLEFDKVRLLNDFNLADEITNTLKKDINSKSALFEELNLLYVAITRARGEVEFDNFNPFAELKKLENNLENISSDANRLGQKWTNEEEKAILDSWHYGTNLESIAQKHKRSPYAIQKRLEKLGVYFS